MELTIQVESLTVDYWDQQRWINIVSHVSFAIQPGETFGLAGESGCGKSSTAYALFGYRRPGSRFRAGRVILQGSDLLQMSEQDLERVRGAKIALVPQNPAETMTPTMRIGNQIIETLLIHRVCTSRREAELRAVDLLAQVGLPEPQVIGKRYPFQLSGGQQQRVITAMALACNPSLLVLDEPTSALDVTTQARLLALFNQLKAEQGMSMVFVSHDLGVLAQICDRVAIMYAGELVEVAPTQMLFLNPRHPYTRGLIAAVPRLSARPEQRIRLRGMLHREDLPEGCRFAPRCDHALSECFPKPQSLVRIAPGHDVACWRWQSIESETEMSRGASV